MLRPWFEARKLARYVAGKRSELEDLDVKDVVMAKAILDIHRKRTHKELIEVPLFELRRIHRLDRENARRATERRVETLLANRDALLAERVLTCEVLARYLPSVSWIKVVLESPSRYLAFEGNGRIAALQTAFGLEDKVLVEAERYVFRNSARIVRRLNRVRRMNGLYPGAAEAESRR